ncbi:hypothetical protein EVAR_42391_1 [Eumeta japonica]|uniref:Uncharacterized protein n=1 Tax=Eumeta variegata TaxID=151549 RepID=A0A4C1YGE6_EUMVA|nr:hypothetical protein EVAR_42391_1 [Eumeta japonica]
MLVQCGLGAANDRHNYCDDNVQDRQLNQSGLPTLRKQWFHMKRLARRPLVSMRGYDSTAADRYSSSSAAEDRYLEHIRISRRLYARWRQSINPARRLQSILRASCIGPACT